MSTSIRIMMGAALVAAGALALAPAGHAGESENSHLKIAPQLSAAGSQVISTRLKESRHASDEDHAAGASGASLDRRGAGAAKAPLGGRKARAVESRFEDRVNAMGGGPETVQEMQRLKEAEEAGGLRASERAFGDSDCGPGVRMPSGASSLSEHMSRCGGKDDDDDGRSGARRRSRGPGGSGWGPPGMGRSRNRGPDPRSFIGDGRSSEKPGAYIGSGRSSSAKSRSGMKDFGSGRAQQGGSSSGRIDEYGTLTRSRREDTDGDGVSDTLTVEREYQDGSSLSYKQTSDGEHAWEVDNSGHDCDADMCFSQADRDADRLADELTGSAGDDDTADGGEAGQPNPVDTGGGGAGRDCLELGIRCGIANKKTPYERMREAARDNGGLHDTMTPQEIFERVGQPVPVPGREVAASDVDDRSAIAGYTPGCDATPEGCGGAERARASSAAAPGGVDRGGIAGFTPTCGGGFLPCGGGSGLKESRR